MERELRNQGTGRSTRDHSNAAVEKDGERFGNVRAQHHGNSVLDHTNWIGVDPFAANAMRWIYIMTWSKL
jgi:hypothetical protein